MDDETDLPDLAALDLDDSNEDFWKLDTSVRYIYIYIYMIYWKFIL